MVNRHFVLAVLLAFGTAMSLIACNSTDKVTDISLGSKPDPPQIVTVLQDPW